MTLCKHEWLDVFAVSPWGLTLLKRVWVTQRGQQALVNMFRTISKPFILVVIINNCHVPSATKIFGCFWKWGPQDHWFPMVSSWKRTRVRISIVFFPPPTRWGSLDFIRGASHPPLPPPYPSPRPPGTAGPQPRAPDLSGHCRTSTASHSRTSTMRARRAPGRSWRYRTSTASASTARARTPTARAWNAMVGITQSKVWVPWFPHVPICSHGFTNHFPPRSVPIVRRRRLLGSTNVQPYSDCFTFSDSRREVTRRMFPVGMFLFLFLYAYLFNVKINNIYI